MDRRFFDWIWNVRGSVPLAPGQSGDDAFKRLDALFHEYGTNHQRTGDILTFSKKDQAAQDKMSVFDTGVLSVEHDPAGPVLRYRLTSRALLLCFLAPLLFLVFAQATKAIVAHQTAVAAAEKKAGKVKEKPKKIADLPMNPIDKALGAPRPETEKEKKDREKKERKEKGEDEAGGDGEGGGKKPSPTPAYVFAGIFAVLYLAGRILEDRLIRSLFRKRLLSA
ncbi:hypothetical protein [uncultured Sphingomonas sp.]|uniref:hypothetical protein n=1 Tax=uncultured Sphingomonas sp. TaxID=158754 RepID=UPI0035CA5D5F